LFGFFLGVREVVEFSALGRLALSGRGDVRLRFRVVRLSPGALCYCGSCRQVRPGGGCGENGSAFQAVVSFREGFRRFLGRVLEGLTLWTIHNSDFYFRW
jgi:hypothetical protein